MLKSLVSFLELHLPYSCTQANCITQKISAIATRFKGLSHFSTLYYTLVASSLLSFHPSPLISFRGTEPIVPKPNIQVFLSVIQIKKCSASSFLLVVSNSLSISSKFKLSSYLIFCETFHLLPFSANLIKFYSRLYIL